MKRKYQGMFSVCLLLAVVLLVGLYYHSGLWQRVYSGVGSVPAPLADGWMPSADQIKTMQRLSDNLQALAAPAGGDAESTALTIFGQHTKPSWRRGQGDDAMQSGTDHALSMTLLAGPVRYCILGGAFVAEGARLKDGCDILKIENKRVLISRGTKKEWLYLEEKPLATDRKNASNPLPGKGSS